jgi:hypothetical protein
MEARDFIGHHAGGRFIYFTFGLNIHSEIDFDLPNCEKRVPDVVIRLGKVPHSLQNPTGGGVLYQIEPRRFLLNVDHVARYLVSDGNEILIDPSPGSDLSSIKLFLFGAVFGALLHQRGILPLHGSAIVTHRGAVVFAGVSGSGKSTLACAFHQKGYLVLSDDICAISLGESPVVISGNPFLMLWADALRELDVDRVGLLPARPGIEKYILPLGEGFAAEAAALHAIYILEPENSELSAPVPVKGLKKIEILTQNIYRPHFVEPMNIRAGQIGQIAEVARRTSVKLLNRPLGSFVIQELVALLERDFNA